MFKKIVVGSDKGGFPLKEIVKEHLVSQGYEVIDVGTINIEEPVLFYQVASEAAECIKTGDAEMGILCCNTGMGMSLVANKFSGIFASVCESVYTTRKCREVNDANILCMGTWVVGSGLAEEMADVFLNTEFTEGLPQERSEYLQELRRIVRELDLDNRK